MQCLKTYLILTVSFYGPILFLGQILHFVELKLQKEKELGLRLNRALHPQSCISHALNHITSSATSQIEMQPKGI